MIVGGDVAGLWWDWSCVKTVFCESGHSCWRSNTRWNQVTDKISTCSHEIYLILPTHREQSYATTEQKPFKKKLWPLLQISYYNITHIIINLATPIFLMYILLLFFISYCSYGMDTYLSFIDALSIFAIHLAAVMLLISPLCD